ncbi:MAG: hypothetical protein M3010_12535 [Candidatus Dormibacteraeota bacterium]|nr:hypothetical protein [Candidatus Dormibacteraeota bacterium]
MLRSYRLPALYLAYVPLLLWADAHVAGLPQQYALGALTFGVLGLGLLNSDRRERRVVALCVVLATGLEVFGSLIWGEYRYRFANVPLYVPAGHGMVCLFALRAARAPLVLRHGRALALAALAVAGAWALAGLSVIPWYLHGRRDTGGALLFPIFAVFVLRSARYRYFVGIFVATTVLELFGTGLGNWTWAVRAPVVGFSAGNPPSVIAGAYCVLDGAVLLAAAALERAWRLGRSRQHPGAVGGVAQSG